MRKLVIVAVVTLLWLQVAAGAALADGMLLPLPEALSPDYLAVRYHRVTVTIEDGHAVTRVDQEFYNPHSVAIAGHYLFPIPPGAIVSGFQATIDGQAQAITHQDAAATNAALYPIITQRHDPSLLQYSDWDSLAFDLSLPPGGSRRMALKYEEILSPAGGLYHYRYVLGTERYSARPLDEVSLVVDLESSNGLASIYSSSHAATVERLGSGRARISWRAEGVRPYDDFDLFFAPAEGGFGAGLLTGQRNGDDHFVLLFAPGQPETDPATAVELPKDIVFIMDRSGSMSGEKIEQARGALQFVLGQLGANDRFSIVGFDDRLSVLSPELQPVGRETLAEARRFVDSLSARDSTDLDAALQAGLDIFNRSERRDAPRLVVFLTDGLPTAGIQDESEIAARARRANASIEARLHVFGVGYDVNTHLLDGLAADHGGTVTYVQPGENLEAALTGFYAQIAHPLLTGVQVEFEGMAVEDVYPRQLPDLFEGSSLVLAGRYRAAGDRATVRIRGRVGGETREYVYGFDLAAEGGHDFVPRLWATRRVGALLDQVRVEGETPALVEEIRGLGLAYGLVTPYTTFVIQGQAGGAASAANMALYGQADLNQASGRTTIQARVQNQAYQAAEQAGLAAGANVVNSGRQSLAQIGTLNLDLSLLREQAGGLPDGPITAEWIEVNIAADRTIEFGSDEYAALARDPEARAYLQSGSNVVFRYQGRVIAVRDPGAPAQAGPHTPKTENLPEPAQPLAPILPDRPARAAGSLAVPLLPVALDGLVLLAALAGLLGLVAAGAVIYRARRDRAAKL